MNDEWISVKDRLPETCQDVIYVYTGHDFKNLAVKRYMTIGHYDEDEKIWYVRYLFASIPLSKEIEITHWMPLPESPK